MYQFRSSIALIAMVSLFISETVMLTHGPCLCIGLVCQAENCMSSCDSKAEFAKSSSCCCKHHAGQQALPDDTSGENDSPPHDSDSCPVCRAIVLAHDATSCDGGDTSAESVSPPVEKLANVICVWEQGTFLLVSAPRGPPVISEACA